MGWTVRPLALHFRCGSGLARQDALGGTILPLALRPRGEQLPSLRDLGDNGPEDAHTGLVQIAAHGDGFASPVSEESKMKKYSVVPFALAAVLAVGGCAIEETPAQVKDSGTAKVKDGKDKKASAEDAETPSEASLGDTVVVGDWDVTVTGVGMNANDVIAKANQFNDPAKGQYVLVTYKANYTGAERTSDVMWDLSWSLTGANQKVNEPAIVVTPADNQSWPTEARKGGTVKQQVAFDVPPSQLKGGLLTVEGMTAGFDTVYADFAL